MDTPRPDAKCRMTFLPFAVIMIGACSRLLRIRVRQGVETLRTASFCGMAGFGRHGADRADAGDFARHADGYGDGRHGVVQHGRRLCLAWRACGSPPTWHAGASGRSHRTLRLLRAAFAYAGGWVRYTACLAAGSSRVVSAAYGVALGCTCRVAAECAATWATVDRQRLI